MYKRNNCQGVITILVTCLLIGVLSVGTLVLESGRFQSAKTQLSEATNSAATSMIAAYNPTLYNRYGLLAIDETRFTQARCAEYIRFNSDLSTSFLGNNASRMYTLDTVELTGLYNLTYPSVLKRQMMMRAKYHVLSDDYVLNVHTMDGFFEDLKQKCTYIANELLPVAEGTASNGTIEDVSEDIQDALAQLYATYTDRETFDEMCGVVLSADTVALLPTVTGTVVTPVEQEDLDAIQASTNDVTSVLGTVGSVLGDPNSVPIQTDAQVDISLMSDLTARVKDVASLADIPATATATAASTRALVQDIQTAIEMLQSDKEGNLLLNLYITDMFANRERSVDTYDAPAKGSVVNGDKDNMTFAGACVEYVFGGNARETDNQTAAYRYIEAIRYIYNLYAVMTESGAFDAQNACQTMAHIAWAHYETCVDMQLLTVHNTTVPLLKANALLDIHAPQTVTAAYASQDEMAALTALGVYDGTTFEVEGDYRFTYTDSLALALWLVPNTEKVMRTADLIQLASRYTEQYVENETPTFLMRTQNTYCRVKTAAKLNALLPIIMLGNEEGFGSLQFSSIKYAGY